MSFAQLPDFPVTPIVGRKTGRRNSNNTHPDVHPYFSTPIYGIPYAVRRDRTVFSGSSALSLSHDKKLTKSSQGQGQKTMSGEEKLVPVTLTNKKNENEGVVSSTTGGRSVSGAALETRSGAKTSGHRTRDVNVVDKSGSGVRANVDVKIISSKHSANNENSKKIPKKFAAGPQSENILQPVQIVGGDVQTSVTQISNRTKFGEDLPKMSVRSNKSFQSSNPSNEKVITRRYETNTNSRSTVSKNLQDCRASSPKDVESTRNQDSNSKSVKKNAVTMSSTTAMNSLISGSECVLDIQTVDSNTSGRKFFKDSCKQRLINTVGKKFPKKSTSVVRSVQPNLTLRQNDQSNSVYDLNSSSESAHQIAKQRLSIGASRKRRIDESERKFEKWNGSRDVRQKSQSKRLGVREVKPCSNVEKTTRQVQQFRGPKSSGPLSFELHVKPKISGRWKSITKPAVEFLSKTSAEVFLELFKTVREADALEFAKCFDELEKRIQNEINQIRVPTTKLSADYSTLTNQQNCLENNVSESSDGVGHLSKLIEKTKLALEMLSADRSPTIG